ncbi:Ldh family oxidoreductase [Prauserella cavernicola]|uniref:Ldh family oxidoreductase n=1 Tax=Prauserella cavernicola TaxID=2800127 RepID=A0A934V878_9PSEU|nr:Ldh family oxidoreductase [Prauserella cavernicola]MBK1787453.1 Ldh family oxidoreductase [Prauserella cavernicola]
MPTSESQVDGRGRRYRIFLVIGLSAVVWSLPWAPGFTALTIALVSFQAPMLVLTIGALLFMLNRSSMTGTRRNRWWENTIVAVLLGFTIFACYHGFEDAIALIIATIANCSHIGCLQSYLLPFTERGLLVTLTATNPGVASVAAPGGTRPVITTNPIAMGIPTRTDPILIDQCTSVGSNALFDSYAARGERLPGQWLLDAGGRPTDDPTVLTSTPPGSIQPLGQSEFGYKGFGFGLMSEALSLALPGYGRRAQPDRHGQGVFLQILDPARFAGADEFLDEVDHLVESIRADPGAPDRTIRLPGERALASRADQLEHGVTLHADTLGLLEPWARQAHVAMPGQR